MARIQRERLEDKVDLNFEPEYVSEKKEKQGLFLYYSIIVLFLVFTIFVVTLIVNNLNREKKERGMKLVELVVPKLGTVIAKRVSYPTSKKVDPDDVSDIFFEVINTNDVRYAVGDLTKFNYRHVEEISIEGEVYNMLDGDSIKLKINKADVKEDILKR